MLEAQEMAFPARKLEFMRTQLNSSLYGDSCSWIDGHTLFQEGFFFLHGHECRRCSRARLHFMSKPWWMAIPVSRLPKYTPRKNSVNSVDILASRVLPFYDRQGMAIKKIHTKKASEYCGLVCVHPYETFSLSSSHIQHVPIGMPPATLQLSLPAILPPSV